MVPKNKLSTGEDPLFFDEDIEDDKYSEPAVRSPLRYRAGALAPPPPVSAVHRNPPCVILKPCADLKLLLVDVDAYAHVLGPPAFDAYAR